MNTKTSKEELLEQFLAVCPDSNHQNDMLRFVKYAVACAMDNAAINEEKLLERLSSERVDELCSAYSWIKMTLDYINDNI